MNELEAPVCNTRSVRAFEWSCGAFEVLAISGLFNLYGVNFLGQNFGNS